MEAESPVLTDTSRRLRKVTFSGQALIWLNQANECPLLLTENPLPPDTQFVRFIIGSNSTMSMVVQSASFEPVPEGTPIEDLPEHPMTMFRRIDP